MIRTLFFNISNRNLQRGGGGGGGGGGWVEHSPIPPESALKYAFHNTTSLTTNLTIMISVTILIAIVKKLCPLLLL